MSYTDTCTRTKQSNVVTKSILITSIGFLTYKVYQHRMHRIPDLQPKSQLQSNIRSHWSYEVIENGDTDICTDRNILCHSTDHFNGIRIDSEALPSKLYVFESKLSHSLRTWRQQNKRGIFLKLPIKYAKYLQIALSNGFQIHHARPEYIMLTQWLPKHEKNMIPDYCHCYLATGCLIVNKSKEAVVIKEIWNHGQPDHWKLPGGGIDRMENISDAAIRETKEETGLDTTFEGILQFRHFHPYRFMNTGDIYFISLLKYDGVLDNGKEFNIDEHEIEEIKWMPIEDVLDLECQQSTFGNEQSKNNIKKNVQSLIENWHNDSVTQLQTLRPIPTKKDRQYYVYAPTIHCNS